MNKTTTNMILHLKGYLLNKLLIWIYSFRDKLLEIDDKKILYCINVIIQKV